MPIRNALTTCVLATCLAASGPACRAAGSSVAPVANAPASGGPQAGASAPARKPAASSPAVYANVRYAYTIEYPANLLVPGNEADNSDGVVFAAKSGTARVAVWGSFNANGDTPAQILRAEGQHACAGVQMSYAVSKRNLVAFSCKTSQNQIVYEKMLIHGDTLVGVQFIYPVAEDATWSAVVREMAGSLHIE